MKYDPAAGIHSIDACSRRGPQISFLAASMPRVRSSITSSVDKSGNCDWREWVAAPSGWFGIWREGLWALVAGVGCHHFWPPRRRAAITYSRTSLKRRGRDVRSGRLWPWCGKCTSARVASNMSMRSAASGRSSAMYFRISSISWYASGWSAWPLCGIRSRAPPVPVSPAHRVRNGLP
jgi:hypothetical protein